MTIKNKDHQKRTEFFYENIQKIHNSKGFAEGILMKLKKDKGLISKFEHVKESFDIQNNRISQTYTVFLPKNRACDIKFRISLTIPESETFRVYSFPDGNFRIECSLNAKKGSVVEDLVKNISNQNYGFQKEVTFLEEVLLPIKKTFSENILYAYRSGDNADKKKGIDFVVGFKPENSPLTHKIEFNLKSSRKHIEEHKERYPKISTFIFIEREMENMEGLKNKFFSFLFSAIKKGVAHY